MSTAIQKFDFHGHTLDVVRQGDDVYVSVRRVCEALGVDPRSQQVKLKKYPWAREVIITSHDTTGRRQDAFCLHLDSLPMWLGTIESNKVRAGVRGTLLQFQLECARVLRDHFYGRRALDHSPGPGQVRDNQLEHRQLYNLARAVAHRCGCSIQRVYGWIRAENKVTSLRFLSLERARIVIEQLVSHLSGEVTINRLLPRLRAVGADNVTDIRQLHLPHTEGARR